MEKTDIVAAIKTHLAVLGISLLAEWDVLIFIYRHGTSLAGGQQIAPLVGYDRVSTGTVLEVLTAKGLISRSRSSHGVRLYRFLPFDNTSVRHSFESLMSISRGREGRLLMVSVFRKLRGTNASHHNGLHLA
jgi:hypothetical protein